MAKSVHINNYEASSKDRDPNETPNGTETFRNKPSKRVVKRKQYTATRSSRFIRPGLTSYNHLPRKSAMNGREGINGYEFHQNNSRNKLRVIELIEYILLNSALGSVLDIVNCLISTLACGIYIFSTYCPSAHCTKEQSVNVERIEQILFVFFCVDYVLRLIVAQIKVSFLLSFDGIVDFVSLLPGIIQMLVSDSDFQFLRAVKMLRVVRIFRMQRIQMYFTSMIHRQLFLMVLTIMSLAFICAGVIQFIENFNSDRQVGSSLGPLHFHDAFYFIFVTMSTVGYGDIYPRMIIAKGLTVIFIIVSLVVIPRQAEKVITLWNLKNPYQRKRYDIRLGRSHVLVCGTVSPSTMQAFVQELFHEDHGSTNVDLVMLSRFEPSMVVKSFLNDPEIAKRFFYLQGSPFIDKDLERSRVESAQVVFIIANQFTSDPDSEDAVAILSMMSIQNYVSRYRSRIPTQIQSQKSTKAAPRNLFSMKTLRDQCLLQQIHYCVQLIRPANVLKFRRNRQAIIGRFDQIVCIEKLKMSLLARSCDCPGIQTLICNLVTCQDQFDENKIKSPWIKEYMEGASYEFYRTKISDQFEGLTFTEVANIMYEATSSIVMALEVTDDKNECVVLLNPGDLIIDRVRHFNAHVFVLSESRLEAEILQLGTALEDKEKHDEKNKKEREWRYWIETEILKMIQRLLKNKTFGENSARPSMMEKAQHSDSSQRRVEPYITCSKPRSIEHMMVKESLETDFPQIRNHIVVCDSVANLYHFVKTLRANTGQKIMSIVILHETIHKSLWHDLGSFPRVFFVEGSPLVPTDLKRAGILYATRAVVIARPHSIDSKGYSSQLMDADNIFAFHGIKYLNPNCEVVMEVLLRRNIALVSPLNSSDSTSAHMNDIPDYLVSPLFAAGGVYTSTMLDTLVCQAYFNRNIVDVLEQFVSSKDNEDQESDKTKPFIKYKTSSLYLIQVPTSHRDKPFRELFVHFVKTRNIVPIALYRGVHGRVIDNKGASELKNTKPYVYTCPHPMTIVRQVDRVYVLAQEPMIDMGSVATFLGSNIKRMTKLKKNASSGLGLDLGDNKEYEDKSRDSIETKSSCQAVEDIQGRNRVESIKAFYKLPPIDAKSQERVYNGESTSSSTSLVHSAEKSTLKEDIDPESHGDSSNLLMEKHHTHSHAMECKHEIDELREVIHQQQVVFQNEVSSLSAQIKDLKEVILQTSNSQG